MAKETAVTFFGLLNSTLLRRSRASMLQIFCRSSSRFSVAAAFCSSFFCKSSLEGTAPKVGAHFCGM